MFAYGPLGLVEPAPGCKEEVYQDLKGSSVVKADRLICRMSSSEPKKFACRRKPTHASVQERGVARKMALQK